MHDDGRIDLVEKFHGRIRILGDNAFGMPGAIAGDMGERAVKAFHDFHREDRFEILGAPVLFRGRQHGRHERACGLVSAQLTTALQEVRGDLRQKGLGDGLIHQQGLQRAADAGAAHLGIESELDSHLRIGGLVDEHVAEAFQVADHRHAGLLLHTLDQALPAARDNDIELSAKPGQDMPDGSAVGCGDKLHEVLRQARPRQRAAQGICNGRGGIEAFRATAQDHRVARAYAQARRIGRDVGPGLIDDPDHAERD